MNKKRSTILEILIHKATQKAYANASDWMGSDPTISSELRDGIRTARNSFAEIDAKITDQEIILNLMLERLDKVLRYYQQLPGNYGQWECSALNIIGREIKSLIKEKFDPTSEDILDYKAEDSKRE